MGSKLIAKDILKNGNFEQLTKKTADALAIINKVRK